MFRSLLVAAFVLVSSVASAQTTSAPINLDTVLGNIPKPYTIRPVQIETGSAFLVERGDGAYHVVQICSIGLRVGSAFRAPTPSDVLSSTATLVTTGGVHQIWVLDELVQVVSVLQPNGTYELVHRSQLRTLTLNSPCAQ